MTKATKRTALDVLTVKRLARLCDAFELSRTGVTLKDDLVDTLARSSKPSAWPGTGPRRVRCTAGWEARDPAGTEWARSRPRDGDDALRAPGRAARRSAADENRGSRSGRNRASLERESRYSFASNARLSSSKSRRSPPHSENVAELVARGFTPFSKYPNSSFARNDNGLGANAGARFGRENSGLRVVRLMIHTRRPA